MIGKLDFSLPGRAMPTGLDLCLRSTEDRRVTRDMLNGSKKPYPREPERAERILNTLAGKLEALLVSKDSAPSEFPLL